MHSPASFTNIPFMREISSADNRIVKQAASLTEKKYRDALGMYLIEGPNYIRDAISSGGRLRFIFMKAGTVSGEAEETAALAERNGPAVITLPGSVFQKICSTETSQGIVAVADKRVWTEDAFFSDRDGDVLVLDRIQDPGNLGTMLRTAEAMGFCGAMLIKGCCDVFSPKTVRAAAGSVMRLPLLFTHGAEEALKLLAKHGKTPYAGVMSGGTPCFRAELAENAAIVIGNEGSGVSPAFLNACGGLTIPMAGEIESLNAAAAAGILMYEAYRQRALSAAIDRRKK